MKPQACSSLACKTPPPTIFRNFSLNALFTCEQTSHRITSHAATALAQPSTRQRSQPPHCLQLYLDSADLFQLATNDNSALVKKSSPITIHTVKPPLTTQLVNFLMAALSHFIAENAKLPFIPLYLHPENHELIYEVNFASVGFGVLS
ncbi:hypothetical protein PanWU01x14_261390 [Parasponia andersonii]|uniref:Uncharacterized protein n=1 Tax=Parasponia andersonii TaxID=3476 RepID=A0A2P5B8K4_PARAD|nr:hypothetical protein PanWU01x14_261390 [Parasponia andersonii]